MAGHSKFKNIMYRKGAQDLKRAKKFAKLSKEITVAVKMGGSDDMGTNSRLRLAVATARAESMPKDNITRAIKKGMGNSDTSTYEEITYEGYGVGGIAVVVEALTDNRNRSASDIRSTFSKSGGNLGENGSVSFMFDKVGELVYSAESMDAEEMFELAMEAGAADIESDEDGHTITTEIGDFASVLDIMNDKIETGAMSAGLVWRPQNTIELDLEKTQSVLNMVDKLEDLEDVQKVYTNIGISDDIADQLT